MKNIFKIILFTITLFLISLTNVNASTNTYDRNNLPNYGINKKIEITIENKNEILNTLKVDANEKIYDFKEILGDEEEKKLYNQMISFSNKYNTDMIYVSTGNFFELDNKNLLSSDSEIDKFYNYNDFGINYDNYNGFVLVEDKQYDEVKFKVYKFGDTSSEIKKLLINLNEKLDTYTINEYNLPGAYHYEAIKFYIQTITNYYDRNSNSNHYVNKKWNINNNNIDNVINTPVVDKDKKIYDYADILTDEEEEKLSNEFKEFTSKYKSDIVFLSIFMPYSNDKENEDFAADFYDYNDFGIDFDNYNGILLLRNNYTKDKYFNVYMFGNAQLYVSYNRAEDMLDMIYPSFTNSNYYEGIELFKSRVASYYDTGVPDDMKNYILDNTGHLQKVYKVPYKLLLIISFIVTTIIISILIKRNKMIVSKSGAGDYLNNSDINWRKKEDKLVHTHTSSYTVSHDSGGGSSHSSGGSYSSSSGSSGGGHSSGGGRHG